MSCRTALSAGLAATALLVTACGESAPPEDDAHGHGHHDHDADPGGHDHADSPNTPGTFRVGSHNARLLTSAKGIRLQLTASDGSRVTPSGVARVVLTGTGEDSQRLELTPEGDGWVAVAKAHGAPGYVAVVRVELDGHTEAGRVSWGAVPELSAPPTSTTGPTDDDGDAHGHGHGHGH